jgi:hypothetical protein
MSHESSLPWLSQSEEADDGPLYQERPLSSKWDLYMKRRIEEMDLQEFE